MTTDLDDDDWARVIKARRKKLKARIHELEKQLKALDNLAPSESDTGDDETTRRPGKRKASPLRKGEFRNKIREIVQNAPVAMTIQDVARTLEEVGFKTPGTTSFTGRVGTELYKLRVAKEIVQTPQGYVWPKK